MPPCSWPSPPAAALARAARRRAVAADLPGRDDPARVRSRPARAAGRDVRELPPVGSDVDLGRRQPHPARGGLPRLPQDRSRRSRPRAVPKGQGAARCDACHVDGWTGIVGPSAKLAAMPPAEPPRVVLARPNLKFNHKLHATRGIACALCHANADMQQAPVTRADLADDGDLPRLSRRQAGDRALLGLPPHRAGRAAEDEARQRGDDGGGRRRARWCRRARSRRHRRAHGPTFKRDHAQAGRDEKYCLTCHKRNECIDCHGGVVRPPDIHPATTSSLHAIDARRNTPDCSACHRTQSFCVGCHQRSGVGAGSRGGTPRAAAEQPVRHRDRAQDLPPARVGARRDGGVLSRPRARPAIRWPPSATSAPASPATARRAASPAIRRTRPAGRPSRPTVPASVAQRVVGSWRRATSAPASSATPLGRWN